MGRRWKARVEGLQRPLRKSELRRPKSVTGAGCRGQHMPCPQCGICIVYYIVQLYKLKVSRSPLRSRVEWNLACVWWAPYILVILQMASGSAGCQALRVMQSHKLSKFETPHCWPGKCLKAFLTRLLHCLPHSYAVAYISHHIK